MSDALFDKLDATGLADAIRTGELTAREAVDSALRRIEERNPDVNAVIALRADEAQREADAVTASGGPLAGVPFVVKDLKVAVAGMATSNGSRLLADAVAHADSEIVARYRRAGVVVVGTTNTPEWGLNASTEPVAFGPTRNPHRLTHSAGGSSGGTAAAVASGMVPIGHGNDSGGSLRIPASACGLVGLKPTRGRTPTHPLSTAFASPLSINHALTRTVRDSALLLDIGAGPLAGDPYVTAFPARPYVDEVGADPGRLRVAVSSVRPGGEPVHPDCAAATSAAAALLEELGHDVVEATPEYDVDAHTSVMGVLMLVPLALAVDARLAALGRDLRDDDLEPFTRVMYEAGRSLSGVDVVRALESLERASRAIGSLFVDHDVLVTPTIAQPTPPLGHLDTTDPAAMYARAGTYSAMTSPFNITGQPAISLPLGRDHDGMPLGVQLVAAFGREDLLLRVASQLEAARPWDVTPAWPPPATTAR